MKNIIFAVLLTNWLLVGCSSSLSLVQLNQTFIKSEKPLSAWDKDLLNTRNKAFERLNVNLGSISTLFLIEKYDVETVYYYGLLYLDENKYFHFCREGFSKEIVILNKELTNTERFIVTELKKGVFNNIKEKSRNTDLISPSSLYITIAQDKAMKQVRFFRFQEFYID